MKDKEIIKTSLMIASVIILLVIAYLINLVTTYGLPFFEIFNFETLIFSLFLYIDSFIISIIYLYFVRFLGKAYFGLQALFFLGFVLSIFIATYFYIILLAVVGGIVLSFILSVLLGLFILSVWFGVIKGLQLICNKVLNNKEN